MLATFQTKETLLALANSILDADSRGRLMKRDNLRTLSSSLGNALRSVVVARNESSLINKIPPETLATISEFVAEPRIHKSRFEIVKLTHVCQYWRSTLIPHPYLWTSVFVKNDHPDFVAACLERSQGLPLTVHLDLKYGDYHGYHDCTCIRNEWTPGMRINEDDPCRYHTTIGPLRKHTHIERIRELDVNFTILDRDEGLTPDQCFKDALDDFKFFESPLPQLESLSFRVHHELDINTHLAFPRDLFSWRISPPTKLRHLALHGCHGGPILAASNLTSLELTGDPDAVDCLQLDKHTFLPLISKSPSLVSLHLSHFSFPEGARLYGVATTLPELKSLKLIDITRLNQFSGLIKVPAFKTLTKLLISTQKQTPNDDRFYDITNVLVRAENDGGFQLVYDAPAGDVANCWLGITHGAKPRPEFVRFEGQPGMEEDGIKVSPLPLYANAKILEIPVYFARPWYRGFWRDLEGVGPQLTTLRLEVTDDTSSKIARLVKKFIKARFQKGTPFEKLERLTFEGTSEEEEEKAKRLWEEFRASLSSVDRYLIAM